MKVLLVYPLFPPSFWGGNYVMGIIGKGANMPPLGLLTVAAMMPKNTDIRLIDMNINPLTDQDIAWADVVMISAMIVQKESLADVIARCNKVGVPVVAGGPYPTTFFDEISGVSTFVLDEVEDIFPKFLDDFAQGCAKKIYRSSHFPDIKHAPLPRFDLIDCSDYHSMALQFSRGCPFDCEFCDITKLFGRMPRTKTNEQMTKEFDALYELGWRGSIFLVDDNFIGNKHDALRFLPAVAQWQKERHYPFSFYTEASVNLCKMDNLLDVMVEAGFTMVFLGIESPNPEALKKTKKHQNVNSRAGGDYLLDAVRTIQKKGIEVTAGFIVGLDSDGPQVFDSQIEFIKEAGIPAAMVGLLTAVKGTDLYLRLEKEGRILSESTGNNVAFDINFIPELDKQLLLQGYKKVLATLYDPTLSHYFERCWTFFKNANMKYRKMHMPSRQKARILFESFRRQILSRQGPAYLRFLLKTLCMKPRMLPEAIRLAVIGYHFQKYTEYAIAASKEK